MSHFKKYSVAFVLLAVAVTSVALVGNDVKRQLLRVINHTTR